MDPKMVAVLAVQRAVGMNLDLNLLDVIDYDSKHQDTVGGGVRVARITCADKRVIEVAVWVSEPQE